MTRFLPRAVCVCALLFLAAGCGKGLYQVKGKVHFPDGAPLDQGRVVFNSTDGVHGASSDPLGEDGTFVLGSFTSNDGVPPGRYTVAIIGAAEAPVGEGAAALIPKYLIDTRFMDPATSGLTFEVKADGSNFLDITVEKPKPSR